jgi:hypothetical protein
MNVMLRTSVVMASLLLGGSGVNAAGGEWFVSVGGDDANPGTRARPFGTPGRAMEAVRAEIGGGLRHDLRVTFLGGVYELDSAWVVRGEDSGSEEHSITYAAEEGAEVVMSGGRRIGGWKERGGVWEVEVPDRVGSGRLFRQLVVNGRRAVRARWPDEDGVLRIAGVDDEVRTFRFEQELPEGTFTGQGAELVVYENWSVTRGLIVGESDSGELSTATSMGWMGHGPATTASPGKPAYVEHVGWALDRPGEWYREGSRTLRYIPRPGEELAEVEVVVPVLEQLLRIEGTREHPVRNVHFKGIRFEHTDFPLPVFGYSEIQAAHYGPSMDEPTHVQPVAVQLVYAEGIRFEGCRFAHLNGSGIGLGVGARGNRLQGCEVEDIGGNGIMVGWRGMGELKGGAEGLLDADWADPGDAPLGNEVVGCVVRRCGQDSRGAVGIWVAFSADTRVAENEVYDLPYTGISVGYRWNTTPTTQVRCVVEKNHIHHVMQKLADGGGIYTLGYQPGTVFRENRIHDVPRSRYAHGGAPNNGFFIDEGSKGFSFVDNVVYATSGDSVRFNQCQREWHEWRGNQFER